MSYELMKRVLREGLVDTEAFRYVCTSSPGRVTIKRLPLAELETVRSIRQWETVMEWRGLPF